MRRGNLLSPMVKYRNDQSALVLLVLYCIGIDIMRLIDWITDPYYRDADSSAFDGVSL